MTQYKEEVQRQKDLLKAEEWANGVECLHIHGLSSMWYDNRPEDTADGKMVTDKTFNSGLIERTLENGSIVHFGNKLQGDELIWKYKAVHA